MKLNHLQFDGIMPLVDSTMLPENAAILAENYDLRRGDLVPYQASSVVTALPDANRKNIYKYRDPRWVMDASTPGATTVFDLVANGAFAIYIDNVWRYVTGLDFTAGAPHSTTTIAALIETAIEDQLFLFPDVTYSSGVYHFSDALRYAYLGPPLAGTDISVAAYLNGEDGNTVISNSENTEWLSWVEEDIDVVSSPVNADKYNRIFILGESDGNLTQKGTFGSRDVFIENPNTLANVALTRVFDVEDTTCTWEDNDPAGSNQVACTFARFIESADSYIITFEFPGYTTTGLSAVPVPSLTVNVPGIGDLDLSDLNIPHILSDSGSDYAEVKLYGISGVGAYTATGVTPTIQVVWDPFTITVSLSMGWYFPPEYFYYLMTYVNDLGQEGPPSDVSAIINRQPYERVTLSSIPVSSDSNIIKKRIYRSNVGNNPAEAGFQLSIELDNATTSYIDWNRSGELGVSFAYRQNPVPDMKGLVSHPARFFVAFRGDEVFFTEPYLPHAWNHKKTVDSPVVGLAISGNDVVVLTTGRPTIFSGVNPASLRESKLMIEQSCVAKRSIVKVGNIVSYFSPDGVIFISGGQAQIVTKDIFHPVDWRGYVPENATCVQHDNKIFSWMDGLNLVLDVSAGLDAATTITPESAGSYNDLFDDTLYYILGSNIMEWEGDASNVLLGKWRGRNSDLTRPTSFAKIRVVGESYPTATTPTDLRTKLRIYVNDSLFKEMIVLSDSMLNLPIRRGDDIWSLEVNSYVPIHRIEMGQSTGDFL